MRGARARWGVARTIPKWAPRVLQVQRVIHNLAKNWVLTEAAIIDLTPDDLRRLDVPASGIPQRGCSTVPIATL